MAQALQSNEMEATTTSADTGPMFSMALRGYARDEVDAHFTHIEREIEHLRAQLREALQAATASSRSLESADANLLEVEGKLEATDSALAKMVAEMERTTAALSIAQAERDAALALTANLHTEENAAREVLKAAHKTADEMREQGRSDAQARVVAAEEHVQLVEARARKVIQDLEANEAVVRARYERFLVQARDLASGFVRQVDESRDKA